MSEATNNKEEGRWLRTVLLAFVFFVLGMITYSTIDRPLPVDTAVVIEVAEEAIADLVRENNELKERAERDKARIDQYKEGSISDAKERDEALAKVAAFRAAIEAGDLIVRD